MAYRKPQPLAPGYTAEADAVSEQSWCELLAQFDDANIYQTWSYGKIIGGLRNLSHVVLRKDGEVVAVAQARLKKLPVLNLGIAYVQWGPIWQRKGSDVDPEIFRQAIRAVRNEFIGKRGLSLRMFPCIFDSQPGELAAILEEEGFSSLASETKGRTILMDLHPTLQNLRDGMNAHWKRELKVADRNNMEIREGTGPELFAEFVEIYKEMVSRKKFVEPNDIHQFAQIQALLPENQKMRVMLCKSGTETSAGVIYSAMGNSAIYLFGATSNTGMKSRGSYALQWKVVETLKEQRISLYNLNGINPVANPGTYKFKNDLAGKNARDVFYCGRFEAHSGAIGRFGVGLGEVLRTGPRKLKQLIRTTSSSRPSLRAPKSIEAKDAAPKSQVSFEH
jgi:lipid II:glycine glycyltransferase (peptidoglycan interpeptide bridge formation enzyme)